MTRRAPYSRRPRNPRRGASRYREPSAFGRGFGTVSGGCLGCLFVAGAVLVVLALLSFAAGGGA